MERQVLDSWKEISAYLGRSEVTCRRLETELGLPIHRLEDSPKARVFAYKDEIDLWIEKTQHSEKKILLRKSHLKKRIIPTFLVIALAILITVSVILVKKPPSRKRPLIQPSHKQLTFTGNASRPAISPDGKFIAYVDVSVSNDWKLMVQELISGQTLEILSGIEFYRLQWLPDGSELFFNAWNIASGQRSYILPRLGGTPRKIDAPWYIAWAPDGFQFAGLWQGSKKFSIGNKSKGITNSIELSLPFMWVQYCDWSPLGNFILLVTIDEEEQYSIWTISPDGNKWNRVIEDNVPIYSAHWSPSGDAIFYSRGKQSARELWKIPVFSETGKPSKPAMAILSVPQAGMEFSLTNDGRRLLHTRELRYSNLWLATVEKSEKGQEVKTKQLTSGTLYHDHPQISPDGSFIAFSRGDGMTSNIYTMPVEGGGIKQITFFNSSNGNPAWSPDGKEIAFGSNEGGVFKVWKVSTQGGTPYQFAESKLSDSMRLTWSPQSNILYQRQGNRNFHILNPETEEEIPLIKDDSVGWAPLQKCSPDGNRIALNWNRNGFDKDGIWVISLGDSSQKLLKQGLFRHIDWSEDGRWVHAVEYDSLKYKPGKEDYIKIELESGQVTELPVIAFKINGESYYKTINERPEIFIHSKTISDIWMIENFDPDIK
jgi:Tol biopolymer transport system component